MGNDEERNTIKFGLISDECDEYDGEKTRVRVDSDLSD